MPSIVAPMKMRWPAVVMPPPRLGCPVLMPLAASSSNSPSGMRQTMSPVSELTAMSSPHGGSAQLYFFVGSQNRPPSGVTLLMFGTPSPAEGGTMLGGRSGGSPPRPRAAPPAAPPARPPGGSPPAPPPPTASASRSFLEMAPLSGVHDVRDHQAQRLVVHDALPVAAA